MTVATARSACTRLKIYPDFGGGGCEGLLWHGPVIISETVRNKPHLWNGIWAEMNPRPACLWRIHICRLK